MLLVARQNLTTDVAFLSGLTGRGAVETVQGSSPISYLLLTPSSLASLLSHPRQGPRVDI